MGTFNVVKKTVSSQFNVKPSAISKNTHLDTDLNFDSLDKATLQCYLESKLKKFVPMDENWIDNMQTVDDIVKYVDQIKRNRISSDVENPLYIVKKSVTKILKTRPVIIRTGTDLEKDLGLDSLDKLEIQYDVEKHCKGFAPLDDTWMADMRTVGDIVNYVNLSVGARRVNNSAQMVARNVLFGSRLLHKQSKTR